MSLKTELFRFGIALPGLFLRTKNEIDAVWGDREATRRLAKVRETRALFVHLRPIAPRNGQDEVDFEMQCRRKVPDDAPTGDPKDVHIIIEPRLSVGHEIADSEDGSFALETVETHDRIYTVLRLHGRIIGMCVTGVIRMEKSGPCRVV